MRKIGLFSIIKHSFKTKKRYFILWQLFSFCETMNSVLTPMIVSKLIFDLEKSNSQKQAILRSITMFLGFIIALEVVRKIAGFLNAVKIQPVIKSNLQLFAFKNILSKDKEFFNTVKSGEYLTKVSFFIEDLPLLIKQIVQYFLPNIITTSLFITSFLYIDKKLGMCIIIGTFFQVLNMFIFGRRAKNKSMKSVKTTAILNNSFAEMIKNICTTNAINQEEELLRFKQYNQKDLHFNRKALLSMYMIDVLMGLIFILTALAFFFIVFDLFKNDKITIPMISYCFLSMSNYISVIYFLSFDVNMIITKYAISSESMSILKNEKI